MDSSRRYPLQRKWCIWEQWNQNENTSGDFLNYMENIGSFETLHSFWQHWHVLPHSDPTKLFFNRKENVRKVIAERHKHIDGIGLFEEGVQPAWEDEVNKNGSDILARKEFEWDKLKDLWTRLVFAVIGETLPYSELIVGVRIIDKYYTYKIEIWLRQDLKKSENAEKLEVMKEKIKEVVFKDVEVELSVNSHKPQTK